MGIEWFHNHPNIQGEGVSEGERGERGEKGNETVWMN